MVQTKTSFKATNRTRTEYVNEINPRDKKSRRLNLTWTLILWAFNLLFILAILNVPLKVQAATGANISINAEGLYYVSADTIAKTLGISRQKVRRKINRNRLSLTHEGLAVAWKADNKGKGLFFYGTEIDSPYTDHNIYQLTRGRGKRIPRVRGRGPDAFPSRYGFTTTVHMEKDQLALTGIFDDPNADYWLWEYLFAGYEEFEQKSFIIEVPDLMVDTEATLTIHFKGNSGADHTVIVAINGTVMGEVHFSNTISHNATLDVPPGVLTLGDNTVTLTAAEPPAGYSLVYIDSFDLTYKKAFTAFDDHLFFNAEGRFVVTVDGFSNDHIKVFEITDPLKIIRIKAITTDKVPDGTFRVSLSPENPQGRYLALAEQAIKTLGGEDLMTFSVRHLRRTGHSVDYLVITPDELKDEAQRLADYRQSRGLSTMVVCLQNIYDEFNYGIANPEAVRDFLEYVWHNWKQPPRYVVRVGDGSYDYKNVKESGDTLMPPLMVSTPWGLYASENRLADVDGSDDGLPEMVMGLLPAEDSTALAAMVDKIIAYEKSGGEWKNKVLMVADNPDGGGNFPASSDAVAALVPEGYTTESIYLGDLSLSEAKQALSTGLNEGAFLMNYIGHAKHDKLAHEGLWTVPDVDAMTNPDRLPILLGMTCLAGRFEIPGIDAIGEAMVVKPDGGAIAAWVPTGLSLNYLAKILDEEFFTAVFNNNETVLGDAVMAAMTAYKKRYPIGNPFMLDIYTLIGDPALTIKK